MSFLQPMLLAALPLMALPIIIHLINQRRYQSVRWGAMMFLLAANRMSRGYARLRQWLIMAVRILAIATLIFAISRPLAGGWLGLAAGGRADTTMILVDRSPSMQQQGGGSGGSKLDTGIRQLASTLETLGSSRFVLIDSGSNKPRELESVSELVRAPGAGPATASADLPAMLQSARDYIKANKPGRTEIWICSDIRANDWNAESGRWQALRDSFNEFPQGVRFHLLAYPQSAPANLSVRVTNLKRRQTGDAAELLLSLRIRREGGENSPEKQSIPVQFEIDGARSEMTVEMVGASFDLEDHRIPLDRKKLRGWGRVSIPADANSADNDFWFVFEQPVTRKAIIVAEDAQSARPLQLAAAISPDPALACAAEVLAPEQLSAADWENTALLLWQGPPPEADVAATVKTFVDRGGVAIFFPPRVPTASPCFGLKWTTWKDLPAEAPVENWRGDQDLLAHTQSGTPLPVGQLQVRTSCGLEGDFTSLATLRGGAPLLVRTNTDKGAAYFCTTTPAAGDSSLATGGVVFYVLVQRALASGATVLGTTQQLAAGDSPRDDPTQWRRVAGAEDALSTDFPIHRGVYSDRDRLIAVNRASVEESAPVLEDKKVAELFRGLDFDRVDDRAGSLSSLIQEIWRLFLTAMLVALVAEAALCLPTVRPAARATSGAFPS
jgi:hypothetical protein